VDLLVARGRAVRVDVRRGRRLGIAPAWLWGYFLVSTLIGISFAVPVFLAHRHRRIRTNGHGGTGAPAGADWIGDRYRDPHRGDGGGLQPGPPY